MDPSTHINWMSPFPILGVSGVLFIFILFQIDIPVSKQWRHWSDTAFCSIWSGSTLFAYVSKNGTLGLYGLIGGVHFQFHGCLVYFFIFILFLIDIHVSQQWRSWLDAAFYSICTVCLCPKYGTLGLYGLTGGVHFQFQGCLVYLFIFILFLIEIHAIKQWRPWSDAAFCSVWSGS